MQTARRHQRQQKEQKGSVYDDCPQSGEAWAIYHVLMGHVDIHSQNNGQKDPRVHYEKMKWNDDYISAPVLEFMFELYYHVFYRGTSLELLIVAQ